MRLLVLDAASGSAMVAVTDDSVVVIERRGEARALAALIADLPHAHVEAVAVTVGPGSFTGLRGALALAHGFAAARGVPLVAVTIAEAMAQALPHLGARALWVAVDSRRERVFLDMGEGMQAVALASLPKPAGPVAIVGDAAGHVAAYLAASGANVMLTDVRRPRARDIAQAATLRMAGRLPPLPALPLYVDPPAVRAPA